MKDKTALAIVGFVWGIIIYETTAYLWLMGRTFMFQNLMLFVLIIPIFCLIVGLLSISYYLAIYTDPGSPAFHVNSHYHDQIQSIKSYAKTQSDKKKQRREDKNPLNIQQQIFSLTKTSFCFKCEKVKQPRVHHCKICKKCIIRMDHHCPWVGNCVGKMNHKYFILFLFYATIGLTIVWISVLVDYSLDSYYYNLLETDLEQINLYVMAVTSLGMSLSIGFLFVTQMISSTANLTTLQSFTSGIRKRNPWDRHSAVRNLSEIFGQENWLIPTNPFPSNSPINAFSAESL